MGEEQREASFAPTEADPETYEVEVNPADFELPEGYDPEILKLIQESIGDSE